MPKRKYLINSHLRIWRKFEEGRKPCASFDGTHEDSETLTGLSKAFLIR
jgi:hypothetical protein